MKLIEPMISLLFLLATKRCSSRWFWQLFDFLNPPIGLVGHSPRHSSCACQVKGRQFLTPYTDVGHTIQVGLRNIIRMFAGDKGSKHPGQIYHQTCEGRKRDWRNIRYKTENLRRKKVSSFNEFNYLQSLSTFYYKCLLFCKS